MNVAPAWQKGYTGKGVVVSILDDGIQTNHPDLAQNYVSIIFYSTHFSILLFPITSIYTSKLQYDSFITTLDYVCAVQVFVTLFHSKLQTKHETLTRSVLSFNTSRATKQEESHDFNQFLL